MEKKKFRPRKITLIKSFFIQVLFISVAFFSFFLLIYLLNVNLYFFISLSFFLTLSFIYMAFIEPYRLEVKFFKIKLKNKSIRPIRAVHISDIHFGNAFDSLWIKKIVRIINGTSPDFIFITGDFLLDEKKSSICKLAGILKGLASRMGIWAVLGNHDLYCDYSFLIDKLKECKIKFLQNQAAEYKIEKGSLYLLGVNDPYHGEDNLNLAIDGIGHDMPKILLAHSPDIIDEAVECGIDLVVAGHTHGGQVRLPGFKKLISVDLSHKKFISGLFDVNGTLMYVNKGIGRVNLPFRLFCRPEIAVFDIE